MNINQKTYFISFLVLLACVALTALIYFNTGNLIIVILFAPPVIYWILKRKDSSKDK